MSDRYRSTTTGDLAFVIERGGKKYMRYDRPEQKIEVLYKEKEWVEDNEHRPMLPHQIAIIKFMAEKYLRTALGDQQGRKMQWEMMDNVDKNAWIAAFERGEDLDGEKKPALVRKLLAAVSKVLDPLGK